jgi:hypothetical protein
MENLDERGAMTEDTWRPWEHRRFAVDRRIIQVETGVDVGEDYKVDFLEPNYALTPESEIAYWEWKFRRGLSEPIDWYDFTNPDANDSDRQRFIARQEAMKVQPEPQNNLLNRLIEEVLVILALLNFGRLVYDEDDVAESLGLVAGINTYMDFSDNLLDGLPYFGNPSEVQIQALRRIHRNAINGVTVNVAESIRSSVSQGIISNLDGDQIRDLVRNNLKITVPRIDNMVGTMLSNYGRAVVLTMTDGLPPGTRCFGKCRWCQLPTLLYS